MGRFGSVEELAATIAFLLSEEAGLYTGQIFTPNGGDWMP
jgi:3-oxoacyl-[acyl-carrier protein] reductase